MTDVRNEGGPLEQAVPRELLPRRIEEASVQLPNCIVFVAPGGSGTLRVLDAMQTGGEPVIAVRVARSVREFACGDLRARCLLTAIELLASTRRLPRADEVIGSAAGCLFDLIIALAATADRQSTEAAMDDAIAWFWRTAEAPDWWQCCPPAQRRDYDDAGAALRHARELWDRAVWLDSAPSGALHQQFDVHDSRFPCGTRMSALGPVNKHWSGRGRKHVERLVREYRRLRPDDDAPLVAGWIDDERVVVPVTRLRWPRP